MRSILIIVIAIFCCFGYSKGSPQEDSLFETTDPGIEMFLDSVQAKKTATDFVNEKVIKWDKATKGNGIYQNREIKVLYPVSFTDDKSKKSFPLYYIVNFKNNLGFAIVSAINSSVDVVAYSFEGSFDPSDVSPSVKEWLSELTDNLLLTGKKIINSSPDKNTLIPSAKNLYSSTSILTNLAVGPLLTSKWDQGCFYNDFCPTWESGPCGHFAAGCLPVSMAQIMKYYNFPTYGKGSNLEFITDFKDFVNFAKTKFNWVNMPDIVTSRNDDVARFLYHLGLAVRIQYSGAGSSAMLGDAQNAFSDFFSYDKNSIKYLNLDNPEGSVVDPQKLSNWLTTIKTELDESRPVLYTGHSGTTFHALVCDGYQDNNYFHFNFGWGGLSDGYYFMGELTENNTMMFLFDNSMLTGIKPGKEEFATDFCSDKTKLSNGERVSFVDLTPGNAVNWKWSFTGSGTAQSSAENPENIVYNNSGPYDVELTVTNDFGTSTILKKGYIKVAEHDFVKQNVPLQEVITPALRWIDLDNDNDMDISLIGHRACYDDVGYTYMNHNYTFTEMKQAWTGVMQCNSAFGDYNCDGLIDLAYSGDSTLISSSEKVIRLYKNKGNNLFEKIVNPFPKAYNGNIIWGDSDNDGDPDIFISGEEYILPGQPFRSVQKLFINNQSSFSEASQEFPDNIIGAKWGDFDKDMDLDLLLTSANKVYVYRNKGSNIFERFFEYVIDLGNISACSWADTDSDCDLDIITIGTNSVIFENTGSNFILTSTPFPSFYYYNTSMKLFDYDNDGDPDLYMSGYTTENLFFTDIYKNSGTNHFTRTYPLIPDLASGAVDVSDYDKDNDLDLLVGGFTLQASYVTSIYRNDSGLRNTIPGVPENLSSESIPGGIKLSWNAASDNETVSDGLTYNLFVGSQPDTFDIVSPMSDINTGFRRISEMGNVNQNTSWKLLNLEPGTYYWSVQAIDNSYSGGKFAPVHSFVINPIITGEEDIKPDNIYRVYPNPFSDQLIIESKGILTIVEILNINAQIVYKGSPTEKAYIPTAKFAPGIYLVKMNFGDYTKYEKLIKK